ncbi:MAG: YbaK/EbsC family protein [Paludibacterium sp.]|uniref:YbaK/EbsC family protein n=1 Tax=Paludibacterium sp. TaxID=1917523 RepID=UPI0025FE7F02|nr:YbaK/EbsC family protein [Paludibacterium sp.]MBV8048506.1 YbaK/EbsC family protein [Paludibacterium sp.]MBV8647366.1 YbaK/EbsC family protein [Paludibacterium sp.]
MSLASVRAEFAHRQIELDIIELSTSTATVSLAAEAHGVEPGRIAKTLAFRLGDERVVLLVARGDARIDNRKFKAALGKGKMLGAHEVEMLTGHPVGGVCPFGLAEPLPVYLDVSLCDFDTVMPAAGGTHTAVRVAPARLQEIVAGTWVNVCQTPQTADPTD